MKIDIYLMNGDNFIDWCPICDERHNQVDISGEIVIDNDFITCECGARFVRVNKNDNWYKDGLKVEQEL